MANPFDQFDQPGRAANPFDEFDEPGQSLPGPRLPQPAPQQLAEAEGSTWGDWGRQGLSGLLEGATGALGAPVDFVNAAIGYGMQGVNHVFGTDFQPSQEPLGGSAGLRRGLAISPESDNASDQFIRRTTQSIGGALVPLAGTAQTMGQVGAGLGAALGGGLGGAAAQQAFPGSVGAEIAGELLGGFGAGGAILRRGTRLATREAERAVPTTEQLKRAAGDKYDEAERAGVTATQADTQSLAKTMRDVATDEGLISPTGRVSEAYPKVREALRLADDYAAGTMSPKQMQSVRKVLSDAAKSTDPAERRMATIMLDRFDNWTRPMAPSLDEARRLYGRAARGEQLEDMREMADANTSMFSGSGAENALRQEYRKMDRRFVKGQERGWTPEQQEAIQRVSRGTWWGNRARDVGRFAPTGPMSGLLPFGALGAGVMSGAPVTGGLLGAGTALAGFGGRGIATAMTRRNAEIAEYLARNGGPLSPRGQEDMRRRVMEAILGGQVALQNQ